MTTLREIKDKISSEIIIPKAFDEFYNWCLEQKSENPKSHFPLGFEWDNNTELLDCMFRNENANRFGVFGSSSDGSLYAFWLDDKGKQKIVYISSDGGAELVLGNTFIEFLQYLSIGYSDPDASAFDLTYEQISARDKIDYEDMSAESINEYNETYEKSLRTEEGIKELFGHDIDPETLKMFLEIHKNAALNTPKIDAETVEKAKKEAITQERLNSQQLTGFRKWLIDTYKIKLPIKGTEILNLNDKSFENWACQKFKTEK